MTSTEKNEKVKTLKKLIEERNCKDQEILKKFKEELEKEVAHVLANNGEKAMRADLRIKRRKDILTIFNEDTSYITQELEKEKKFLTRFLLDQKPWMPRTTSTLTNLFNAVYAEVTAEIISELNSIIDDLK